MKKRFKKKLLATLVFSLISSVLLIIHGIFFDLDLSQIERLSLAGFVFTFFMVFIGLIILEKIFTIEEDEEIIGLKRRLGKLEKKHKRT